MANPPPLHIGWLLDVIGSPAPKVPVNLDPAGLKSHTVIIAQSGSGKSFTLGRFVEEIALKTRARFVIVDPGSDFIKFSEVERKVWNDPRLKPWLAPEDTRAKFQRRLNLLGINVLTQRNPHDLALTHPKAKVLPIFLKWDDLTLLEKTHHLGFSTLDHPQEVYAVSLADEIAKNNIKLLGSKFPTYMELFCRSTAALWSKIVDKRDPSDLVLPTQFNEGGVSPDAAARVDARSYELLDFGIWGDPTSSMSLQSQMHDISDEDLEERILVLDLPSLARSEARLCAASAVLESLWQAARDRWLAAIKKSPVEDRRFPIFIVIDEAHNLAPIEPLTERRRDVTEILVRIATEGRKYGLFLILVTQRPSRLHPGVLSQCDNLFLQKMNNRLDLQLVEDSFGFVPAGYVNRALGFQVGDALLSGSFVERPVYTHIAPRRTVEGGRNLQDRYWLQDPLCRTR